MQQFFKSLFVCLLFLSSGVQAMQVAAAKSPAAYGELNPVGNADGVKIVNTNVFLADHTLNDNHLRLQGVGVPATDDGLRGAFQAAEKIASKQPQFCIPFLHRNKKNVWFFNIAIPVYKSMIDDKRRVNPRRNGEKPLLFLVGQAVFRGTEFVVNPKTFLKPEWVLGNNQNRSAKLDQQAWLIITGNHRTLINLTNPFDMGDSSSSDDSSGSESDGDSELLA